mgnify:CR=1 FL=1
MVSPSASGRSPCVPTNEALFNSERKNTVSRFAFGSSMPMALRPGTMATRAEAALIERAMSSPSATTRLALTPRAGSSS